VHRAGDRVPSLRSVQTYTTRSIDGSAKRAAGHRTGRWRDKISVFLRITGQSSSEITGPAFTAAGNRLYFSSQRGTTGSSSDGITYCVTGPFRT
jgi:hypothetical protein